MSHEYKILQLKVLGERHHHTCRGNISVYICLFTSYSANSAIATNGPLLRNVKNDCKSSLPSAETEESHEMRAHAQLVILHHEVIAGRKASSAGRRNIGWDIFWNFTGGHAIPPFLLMTEKNYN